MESKKSVVSSFDVDHLTLKEGLYLRSVYRINDTLAVHSWDMRFRAPMAHAPADRSGFLRQPPIKPEGQIRARKELVRHLRDGGMHHGVFRLPCPEKCTDRPCCRVIQIGQQLQMQLFRRGKALFRAFRLPLAVDAEQIRAALARVYKQVFPIKSKDDIVGLNERQCGNPGLYAVASTNEAMAQYMRCLYTREQAEEAGIGSIYNYEW